MTPILFVSSYFGHFPFQQSDQQPWSLKWAPPGRSPTLSFPRRGRGGGGRTGPGLGPGRVSETTRPLSPARGPPVTLPKPTRREWGWHPTQNLKEEITDGGKLKLLAPGRGRRPRSGPQGGPAGSDGGTVARGPRRRWSRPNKPPAGTPGTPNPQSVATPKARRPLLPARRAGTRAPRRASHRDAALRPAAAGDCGARQLSRAAAPSRAPTLCSGVWMDIGPRSSPFSVRASVQSEGCGAACTPAGRQRWHQT